MKVTLADVQVNAYILYVIICVMCAYKCFVSCFEHKKITINFFRFQACPSNSNTTILGSVDQSTCLCNPGFVGNASTGGNKACSG